MQSVRFLAWFTLAATAAVLVANHPAHTAVPAPSDAATDWQLDITYDAPRPIRITLPGERGSRLYWYMTFTVTNNTGEDRPFIPEVTLYTDTGQIVRGGKDVNPFVYQTIKKIHNNPLLGDMVSISGKILQGQDNAKDGMVVFHDFDPQAGGFNIFFGGLSGETTVVELPRPVPVTTIAPDGSDRVVEKQQIVLAKTLALRYALGVQAANRINASPTLISEEWIMR
jgi:hypothetical protein